MRAIDIILMVPINPLFYYHIKIQFLNYLTASGLFYKLNFGTITYLSFVHTFFKSLNYNNNKLIKVQ